MKLENLIREIDYIELVNIENYEEEILGVRI